MLCERVFQSLVAGKFDCSATRVGFDEDLLAAMVAEIDVLVFGGPVLPGTRAMPVEPDVPEPADDDDDDDDTQRDLPVYGVLFELTDG